MSHLALKNLTWNNRKKKRNKELIDTKEHETNFRLLGTIVPCSSRFSAIKLSSWLRSEKIRSCFCVINYCVPGSLFITVPRAWNFCGAHFQIRHVQVKRKWFIKGLSKLPLTSHQTICGTSQMHEECTSLITERSPQIERPVKCNSACFTYRKNFSTAFGRAFHS